MGRGVGSGGDGARPGDRPGSGRSRFVDYEQMADRYQQGRALSDEVLARWARAVRPHLPPGPCRVIDVGAGTGIFAAAWPRWTAATVVAVEPSSAMMRTGRAAHPAVGYVRGVAEALPLPDGCADVVWVSTALHHFADVDRAIAELGRVLGRAGRLLVRTYLPGRTEFVWARAFSTSARAKWEGRVHRQHQLASMFGAAGFVLTAVDDVVEQNETYGDAADWIERMRHADSLLTALTDDEVAEAVARLRSAPATIGRSELTLLVFTRP